MKCYLILFYINKNVTLKNKDEKIQLINEKKRITKSFMSGHICKAKERDFG